jgi:hypothetical protein
MMHGRELTIGEPDFSGNALKNVVPEVDRTLRIIKAQAAICKLAGTVGPETYFDQTILVAKAHIKTPGIYMDRRETNNANVSGWYLGPVGASDAPTENDLELLYTYQLVSLRPALLKTLCLPVNYLVVFDGDRINKLFDAKGHNLWPENDPNSP